VILASAWPRPSHHKYQPRIAPNDSDRSGQPRGGRIHAGSMECNAVNVLTLDIAEKNAMPASEYSNIYAAGQQCVVSTERHMAACYMRPQWDQETVELVFATVELRNICENRKRATAAMGPEAARELSQRLADLAAFATVAELADVFPTDIIDRSPTERALRLQAGHDLIFRAGHVQVPTNEDGETDWVRVSRIRITALEARNG
jgi:hypothetical protein